MHIPALRRRLTAGANALLPFARSSSEAGYPRDRRSSSRAAVSTRRLPDCSCCLIAPAGTIAGGVCDSAAHPRGWSARRERVTRTRRPVWGPVTVRGRYAQAPRSLSPAVGPGPFPKLLRGHAPPVGGEVPRPARLPLQLRRRRRRGRVAVLLRVRGGFRRCGGSECGAGIPRGSGSARGRPELRYRRRRRAELRTPRRLSRSSEPIRPCPCAPIDRATNATLTFASAC